MPVQQPNILLITTDTQRTDTLCCMGSRFASSPNLDRLASEGVLFTRAYTAAPACMPARCSLLSGLHTPLHGCIENGVNRYEDMPVFTDCLKELGYCTIMVGKTHFGSLPSSFDIHEIVKGEKNQVRNDDFSSFFRESGYPENSCWPNLTPEAYCLDALIVNRTLHHIERARNQDQPFFAFCSLLSPHSPLDPPALWEKLYQTDQIPAPHFRNGEWKTMPIQLRQLCGLDGRSTAASWIARMEEANGNIADNVSMDEILAYKALYYSSAAWCDSLIGKLLCYLDENHLRENTFIIFTSDHGQQYFDHGFNDKHNYYEETWRVPLIFSMPGTLPQGQLETFASGTDIAPSIVAAAGGCYDIANGYDLFTPLSRGENLPRHCAAASLQRSMAVVTEKWKLEYYLDDQETRFFYLAEDAYENHNLCVETLSEKGKNNFPGSIKDQMLTALLTWRCTMVNPSEMRKRLERGGPVAERATKMLYEIRGRECEEILERMLNSIEFL